MHLLDNIGILKQLKSMTNIYCFVGNAPDPDEPAEGRRSVGVDLLCGMPFPLP